MSKIIHCNQYDVAFNDVDHLKSSIENGAYSRIIAMVDENAYKFWYNDFSEMLDPYPLDFIRVPSGEENKALTTVHDIWEQLLEIGADRNSLCLCVGGGVTGDMAGFAASTFMRGLDFFLIPTTLLAQVDASVGGKLGVDFKGYKNLIGVIRNPNAVYIFTEFLESLPSRQILSGFAELLKHGLIRNAENYSHLTGLDTLDDIQWEGLIYDSVLLKKSITDEDPNEKGLRKILNFGHTIGHAVESHSLHTQRPLLHGEAIAIGLIVESHLSYELNGLSHDEVLLIKKDILQLYGHHPEYVENHDALIKFMQADKKNRNGKINFTLLKTIGQASYDHTATPKQIIKSLKFYQEG